jgi:hypothetical protein
MESAPSRLSTYPMGRCAAPPAGPVLPHRRWRSSSARSRIDTSSPRSSMVRYHASCPCVWAHACSGECHPGSGLPGSTYRAMSVATHRPTPPRRISWNETVPRPRSGLSESAASRSRISDTGRVRSRFHSRAFIARSRCASTISIINQLPTPNSQLPRRPVRTFWVKGRPGEMLLRLPPSSFDRCALGVGSWKLGVDLPHPITIAQ